MQALQLKWCNTDDIASSSWIIITHPVLLNLVQSSIRVVVLILHSTLPAIMAYFDARRRVGNRHSEGIDHTYRTASHAAQLHSFLTPLLSKKPRYLRNKAASILARHLIGDAGT
jgi:hypothetical protein